MVAFTEGNSIKMFIGGTMVLIFFISVCEATTNLTCYQCERHDEQECSPHDLKTCPPLFDRCALLIRKDVQRGLTVTRKCGLAPCGFDDEMMARGLGMNCDKSKDSYSCDFCCRQSGCNKNKAHSASNGPSLIIVFGLVIFTILNVFRDFIPPYVRMENSNFK